MRDRKSLFFFLPRARKKKPSKKTLNISLFLFSLSSHHVVHHVGLGDLLAPERLRRREVLPVVVAQVVVRDDRRRLDAGADQEVDEHGLHLGLAALEVVAADQDAPLDGEAQQAGHERVLRRAVDEGAVFQNGGGGVELRRRDLAVVGRDGREEGVGRVVDALDDVGVALGVGRPEHDDGVDLLKEENERESRGRKSEKNESFFLFSFFVRPRR